MHLSADRTGIVVSCSSCGKQNRLRYTALDRRVRCAACKTPLTGAAEPVDVPTDEAFEALVSTASLPVLVDFWAEWCGPCRAMAPELERVAASRSGRLIVAKVDTERLTAVASRQRIQSLPTLGLFANGHEAGRISGARPASAILAFVDQHTPPPA